MCSSPELEERDHRSPRMLRCEIVDTLGARHACLLKNISRRGLGGSCSDTLEAGQPVTIHIPKLATLTGSIRWASGGRFGIRLDQEIAPELVRFVGPRNEAAPNFEVSAIHRIGDGDFRRPGF